MKKFITLLTLLLTGCAVDAQDTLVKNNGLVMPGFIVETDSAMIAFSNTDTAAKELNLVQRAELLFIKHRDGNTEQFYSNDTLITMQGAFILGKVLEITPEYVTIFSYNGKVDNIKMITTDEIFMLRLNDGTSEVIDHNAPAISDKDAYAMGVTDAGKYFKVSAGAKAGSVLCGIGTYIYGAGLIGEIAVATSEPKNIHNDSNPNDQLLFTNSAYHSGYMSVAGKKKKNACWGSYAGGVVLPIAAVGILVAAWAASYN